MGIIEKSLKNIKHFSEKKSFQTFFFVLVIVSIAFVSFGLGMEYERSSYLSAHPIGIERNREIISKWKKLDSERISTARFFASKNGGKYYPILCDAGKRIKEENRIYFSHEEEARDAGYVRSARCKF